MSTMLKTDRVLRFDTSNPTVAATTDTLAAAVTTTTQTNFTLTSGAAVRNGTFIGMPGGERCYVVSGGGTANIVVQRGSGATTYTNGSTVNVAGYITFTLQQISEIPNQQVVGKKVSTDINYVLVQRGGSDTFPGGGTVLILADTSSSLGTFNLLAPGSGTEWIQLTGAGAVGPSGASSNALTLIFSGALGSTGNAYTGSLTASGGTSPYTYAIVSGSLPTGLSLNTSTGAITGTPTVAGTFTFTAQATDSLLVSSPPLPCTIMIAAIAGLVLSFAGPSAQQGVVYSGSMVAVGGVQPYTFAITAGALPAGLSLNTSTGAITGTPTVNGSFSFTVRVTDSASTTVSAGCQLVVYPANTSVVAFTIGTLYYQWNPLDTTELWVYIPVTPGTPTGSQVAADGGHIYIEAPDQSAVTRYRVGVTAIGSGGVVGPWIPYDAGQFPYVASAQPWVAKIKLPNVYPSELIRVYVQGYANTALGVFDPAPVEANMPGPTANAVLTIQPFSVSKPNSGVEYQRLVNGITATTGLVTTVVIDNPGSGISGSLTATVSSRTGKGAVLGSTPVSGGVVTGSPSITSGGSGYKDGDTVVFSGTYTVQPTGHITVELADDNTTGQLITPIAVSVDLSTLLVSGSLPSDFAYELWGIWDSDPNQTAIQLTGVQVANGLVPSGPDNIKVPHSIDLPTPASAQGLSIYARSVKVLPGTYTVATDSQGNPMRNSIVYGVTPVVHVTIGSATGTNDLRQAQTASYSGGAAGLNNGIFDVLPLGVDNSRLGSSAVTNPKLASLAVAAANMQSASVTLANAALDNLVVLTGNMANLATTAAKLASASVYTAAYQTASIPTGAYQNLSVGNAALANLAVGSANIQALAVQDSHIANLSVSKLLAGTISVAVSLTAPTITVTGGSFTINLDSTNGLKCTGNSITTSITNGTFGGNPAGLLVSGGVFSSIVASGLVSVTTSGGTGLATLQALIGSNSGELLLTDLSGHSLTLFPGATSSTASAGAAVLPSAPATFLLVTVNGTNYHVPLYN